MQYLVTDLKPANALEKEQRNWTLQPIIEIFLHFAAQKSVGYRYFCLLYTSDAADE